MSESQSPHTGHRLPPSELQQVCLNFVMHRKIPAGHEPQRAANGRHKTQEHACPRTFLRARATICHAQYAEKSCFYSISRHFKSEAGEVQGAADASPICRQLSLL